MTYETPEDVLTLLRELDFEVHPKFAHHYRSPHCLGTMHIEVEPYRYQDQRIKGLCLFLQYGNLFDSEHFELATAVEDLKNYFREYARMDVDKLLMLKRLNALLDD